MVRLSLSLFPSLSLPLSLSLSPSPSLYFLPPSLLPLLPFLPPFSVLHFTFTHRYYYMCIRFDTHIMMGLAHGKVSECTARLALAQGLVKVRETYYNKCTN